VVYVRDSLFSGHFFERSNQEIFALKNFEAWIFCGLNFFCPEIFKLRICYARKFLHMKFFRAKNFGRDGFAGLNVAGSLSREVGVG